MQWNRPSRTDHYLMKLIGHTDRHGMKDPTPINLDDYQIKFSFEKKKPLTRKQREQLAKQKMDMHKKKWMSSAKQGKPRGKR
jgi:hypothetical protein